MNILIFSPIRSHRQKEGNTKRIFTLSKYLQKIGHKIHFVYYTQSGLNKKSFYDMQKEWDSLTIIHKTKTIQRRTGGYALDEWYQDDIHKVVNELISLFNIDAVLVNYIMQSKLLEYIDENILKIIDTHDTFADRHTLYKDKQCRPYTWYSVSKNDEIRAFNRADIILAIQNEEANYFRSVVDIPVKLINHMENKNFTNKSYSDLKKIGFIGSGNHINQHSINEFINEYLNHPISNKEVQIIIAGNVCKTIKVQHKNIVLQGMIDDLEDFYNEVDLIINPLTFGTGLKIKSIEALSYGVPIVSTKIGFEGIDSQHPYHQFDRLSEMVDGIERLYSLPDALGELAVKSKDIFDVYESRVKYEIENLFDSPEHEKDYNDIYMKIEQKEKRILEQHKEIQILKFDNYLKVKENQKLNRMLQSIKKMIHISFIKNPLKKYKAYKVLLKEYYTIRKKL